MGRRSRKRVGGSGPEGATRAERDAARRERTRRERRGESPPRPPMRPAAGRPPAAQRPPAFWAPFPLSELLTLAGIVLMVWGFLSGGGRGANAKIGAGLVIASLGGLELALREHVTGFRSHTSLLSGVAAVAVTLALGFGAGLRSVGVLAAAGLVVFAASFYGLRELFKRRSGGLGFR